MQGKKDYQEKLFVSFRLSDRVPRPIFTVDWKKFWICDVHVLKPGKESSALSGYIVIISFKSPDY